MFIAHEKILAFEKKKIGFWKDCIRSNDFQCFPTIQSFLEEEEIKIGDNFIAEIIQHLKGLNVCFNQYFPTEQQIKYQNEQWVKSLYCRCKAYNDVEGGL